MESIIRQKKLTPETIAGKLFSFHNEAHFYHLQNRVLGKHLLLDELYKALVYSKDEISEYLLGIQIPKRFDSISIQSSIEPFSDANLLTFLNEGFDFTKEIIKYAKENDLEQLANLASDLQGKFVRAKLFTTYQ